MGGYVIYLKALRSPLFLSASVIFFLNQSLESLEFSHFLLRGYLDDLVVVPIILSIAVSLMRMVYKNENLKLDLGMIITSVVLLAILFELILPLYSPVYTNDLYDILCYTFGGVIYRVYG